VGEVVDEQGLRARGALVDISAAGVNEFHQTPADENGRFSANGLPPGEYLVAASGYLQESETVSVTLKETRPASVRLQLSAYRQWRGSVMSADRRPVVGARIVAVPVDIPVVRALSAETDPEGRFNLLVHAASRVVDVRIEPPGYALTTFRQAVTKEPLHVTVDARGGALVLNFAADEQFEAVVWHSGSVFGAFSFLSGWPGTLENSSAGTNLLRIPQMEPGEYTLCLVPKGLRQPGGRPSGRCATVQLPPFGTAEATVPPG
jgi:hypothetical protein